MNFYSRKIPINGIRYGIGFKSKTQLPWFMFWKEWYKDGEIEFATVLFSIKA